MALIIRLYHKSRGTETLFILSLDFIVSNYMDKSIIKKGWKGFI